MRPLFHKVIVRINPEEENLVFQKFVGKFSYSVLYKFKHFSQREIQWQCEIYNIKYHKFFSYLLLSVNPKVCFMYSFHRSCIGRYVSNLKKKLITSFSHSKANKYDRDIPMVTSLYKVIAKDVSNYLCPSFGMSNNFSFLRSRDVRLFLLDSLGLLFFIGLLSRFCLKYSRFSISPLRNLFSGRVALKKFATKSSFTACNKEIQNCIPVVVYWLVGAGEINT